MYAGLRRGELMALRWDEVDLTKNVPRPGEPGVTATTIRVSVITAKTNPLGGKYHEN